MTGFIYLPTGSWPAISITISIIQQMDYRANIVIYSTIVYVVFGTMDINSNKTNGWLAGCCDIERLPAITLIAVVTTHYNDSGYF